LKISQNLARVYSDTSMTRGLQWRDLLRLPVSSTVVVIVVAATAVVVVVVVVVIIVNVQLFRSN